jgi:hypothetical protein
MTPQATYRLLVYEALSYIPRAAFTWNTVGIPSYKRERERERRRCAAGTPSYLPPPTLSLGTQPPRLGRKRENKCLGCPAFFIPQPLADFDLKSVMCDLIGTSCRKNPFQLHVIQCIPSVCTPPRCSYSRRSTT